MGGRLLVGLELLLVGLELLLVGLELHLVRPELLLVRPEVARLLVRQEVGWNPCHPRDLDVGTLQPRV